MDLLKRYWESGALLTAGMERMILGKDTKALEILRLCAEYKTKKKLRKSMLKVLII